MRNDQQGDEFLIADSAPVFIWTSDVHGERCYFNRVWLDYTGRTLEEERGGKWMEGIHPDDRVSYCESFNAALSGRTPFKAEYRLRREDNVFRWVLDTGTPRYNGEGAFIGYIGSCVGISERKQMEAELIRSNSMLKSQQEASIDGILFLDEHHNISSFNSLFCEMWDIHVELLDNKDGRPLLDFLKTRLENPEDFITDADCASAPEHNTNSAALCVRDGRIFSQHSAYVTSQDGGNYGRIWFFRDITWRTKMENELRQKTKSLEELAAHLEQRVEQEVEQRIKQEKILIQQAKMASMGEMIEAITHQWRQPLNSLCLIIQDLADTFDNDECDKSFMTDAVTDSMQQIDYMTKTIDDFRNYFKPAKTKETFDTVQAVKEVLSIAWGQLKIHSISTLINGSSYDPNQPADLAQIFVSTYKNEFKQVILNIVNNARDALKTAPKPREISFGMLADNATLITTISDTGGGIPENILNKIFTPYFTTKEHDKGTGIGLYLSKMIVENNLSGKIYASNAKAGACFTIELPIGD
ncbi:MAG: PAS domain-containing sensor histidine kinase [Nitrospirae bacterium]|nr:PAS domain-containing sensor histidine kinase [Nitrospirota bacterium]